jgi:hypothetical protein
MEGNANGMVLLRVKLTTYLCVVLIFVMFLTFEGSQCLHAGLTENNVCIDEASHFSVMELVFTGIFCTKCSDLFEIS